jgi:DNA repair protein RecO (recombination protein O)
MTWGDEGYILGVNIYGENSSIISILSKDHGHHKGIIYGGTSAKLKKLIHIGNKIKVTWKSKSEDAIGYYNFELMDAVAPKYFDNDKKLTAILSATSICLKILPERNVYLPVYNSFEDLFNSLSSDDFFKKYVLWERFLLSELGYNVDLENKDSLKLFNKNVSYPQYFYDNSAAFTDNDIYNGFLINKHQLLNYIFEPNKVKFPYYRIKLENFFNEK